nr:hypothetical protein [Kibdelosporangium sp. MJ126-NF4]CTQ90787.1 hypothetical protein [Kibdelosporangium sp. MJ126-NF4]
MMTRLLSRHRAEPLGKQDRCGGEADAQPRPVPLEKPSRLVRTPSRSRWDHDPVIVSLL